jgi:hypothetical protein
MEHATEDLAITDGGKDAGALKALKVSLISESMKFNRSFWLAEDVETNNTLVGPLRVSLTKKRRKQLWPSRP